MYKYFVANSTSNRKTCCKVNGHVPKLQDIKCGVPQGSCLGPHLFFIYVNDLPFALDRTKATMYAEDTRISYLIIDFLKFRGQGFDGMSVMSGIHCSIQISSGQHNFKIPLPAICQQNKN